MISWMDQGNQYTVCRNDGARQATSVTVSYLILRSHECVKLERAGDFSLVYIIFLTTRFVDSSGRRVVYTH